MISSDGRKTIIENLKLEFPDVLTDKLGFTKVIEHEIELEPGTQPIKQRPYNLSTAKERAAKLQTPKMLEQEIIEEYKSPWRSPVVMVPKKDSTYRMCVDFRKLNSKTKFDAYPIKHLEQVMDSLKGAQVFSVIDLKSGYWQLKLRESDRDLTSFSVDGNLYRFKVMPFGLKNGCASFQRLMEKVLKKRGCLGRFL